MTTRRKWIFRFKGEPDVNGGAALLSVLESHAIEILDNNLPRLLLASGSEEAVNSAKGELDGRWIIVPENTSYSIPDTRKKLK
jgi:hypothetical protein